MVSVGAYSVNVSKFLSVVSPLVKWESISDRLMDLPPVLMDYPPLVTEERFDRDG